MNIEMDCQIAVNQDSVEKIYWIDKFKNFKANTYIYQTKDILVKKIELLEYTDTFSKEITENILKISKNNEYSIHLILMSLISLLVHKCLGSSEISIGTPIYRNDSEGTLMNTFIPIKNYIDEKQSLKQFLHSYKSELLTGIDNQNYPIKYLPTQIDVNLTDYIHFPLFDTALVYDNIQDVRCLSGLNLNMVFVFSKINNTLSVKVLYNKYVFNNADIVNILGYINKILFELTLNSSKTISEIEIIDKQEKQKIIEEFNNTVKTNETDVPIFRLFEKQASKFPDRIALLDTVSHLSYKELNERTNRLAHYLRNHGVERNCVVAVWIERSIEMVIALLGIHKSGGAFVTIGTEYPEERIRYILTDTNCKFIICSKKNTLNLTNHKLNTIDIEEVLAIDEYTDNPTFLNEPDDIAYILYTSGSTGKPKGVAIEHQSFVNRICWMQNAYPIHERDVILQKTPYTFDVSLWEIFWWSTVGAKLYLLHPEYEKYPEEIVSAIERYNISTIHFVPSMFNVFLDYVELNNNCSILRPLKRIFNSGEELRLSQVEKFDEIFKGHSILLSNLYGPTEAAIDVTYYNHGSTQIGNKIPIGKPIDNTQIYILDKNRLVCPIGILGELCIGGIQVARGYLNKSELTKDKFITNPINSLEVLYKTGDLARWLPDGNIEFIGRNDTQIKIRGNRIEIDEVETNILKIHGIKQVEIIVRKDKNNNPMLVAFVLSNQSTDALDIPALLSETLPNYMIPAHIVKLDSFPLSSNGKLDRKALENYKISFEPATIRPKTEIEKSLVEIWAKVLELDNESIGVESNFFEIGGNSINIIQVHHLLKKEFNIQFPVVTLFNAPSIKLLSQLINEKDINLQISDNQIEDSISMMEESLKLINDSFDGY